MHCFAGRLDVVDFDDVVAALHGGARHDPPISLWSGVFDLDGTTPHQFPSLLTSSSAFASVSQFDNSNELAQEDFRVRVEGVDDQVEKLIDFSLEFAF